MSYICKKCKATEPEIGFRCGHCDELRFDTALGVDRILDCSFGLGQEIGSITTLKAFISQMVYEAEQKMAKLIIEDVEWSLRKGETHNLVSGLKNQYHVSE